MGWDEKSDKEPFANLCIDETSGLLGKEESPDFAVDDDTESEDESDSEEVSDVSQASEKEDNQDNGACKESEEERSQDDEQKQKSEEVIDENKDVCEFSTDSEDVEEECDNED